MPKASAKPANDRAPVSGRWIVVLAVSVMLHFVMLEWADDRFTLLSFHDQSAPVITAQLRLAQPSKPVAIDRPKPIRPKPVARPKSTARPKLHAPPAAPVAAPEPAAAAADAADDATPPQSTAVASVDVAAPPTAIEPPDASGKAAVELPPTTAADPPVIAPQEPPTAHYKVLLPPSVVLKYDVQALRDGQIVYGHGTIGWQSDGENYTVSGEAGILFFSLLNFTSTGVIDDFGVAPVVYAEKRFRKSETDTHFHRERNTISFSASTASYPRTGGEQDRASIIWQLTGIGRGDSEKFIAGTELDFFVAGVRDAETWRMRIIGEEEIETGIGKTVAWHIVRIPRAGSYDQKLDIWLAPQQQWYPVKLRYTETNGDYLDLSLSKAIAAATN